MSVKQEQETTNPQTIMSDTYLKAVIRRDLADCEREVYYVDLSYVEPGYEFNHDIEKTIAREEVIELKKVLDDFLKLPIKKQGKWN